MAIFLSLIPRIKDSKNKIAIEATFLAFLVLVFFFFMGKIILNHLNIALYSFKIAGGIILLLISIEMLFDKRSARKEKSIQSKTISTSIFPLAIPLLAGPAAITSVIVSSSTASGSLASYLAHIVAIFTVLLITCMFFLIIIRSEKFISKKLLQVLSRIIGIILAALSIQFIIDGLIEATKTF